MEHFGRQLAEAGYSFHGGETMISGITGEEFPVRPPPPPRAFFAA